MAETVSEQGGEPGSEPQRPPVVVKKYANRRLYNTEASSYVTLEDLAGMVRQGRDFVVYDAKSGEDITRSVLTQIIVEEEAKGRSLLPTSFLRQLIGFYGDSLGSVVPRYLEFAMGSFARQQEQMRVAMQKSMEGFHMPFGFEEMSKQNMAMMERAMSLFTPFRPAATDATKEPPRPAGTGGAETMESLQAEVASLKRQLEELRQPAKVTGLSRKS
ncbi:polyhydroxyalkanoate synthesis repressor PhaR [Roseomonas sp. NAR14]|uniref:Polyhydroxyalkanoate synthesis repressor PhaR n=1 Tax=Roseomonas acroporae TaxID=2937791 RepID=A0A9X1Y799_9PROT|nr:polyhydroxyalkanoate synthesis repressor PhaR [Roseomonas acroporae]MCK8785479.1 polyhydroxyalkanoate synthesis repressor PhaR [Roseomonas acroporae]